MSKNQYVLFNSPKTCSKNFRSRNLIIYLFFFVLKRTQKLFAPSSLAYHSLPEMDVMCAHVVMTGIYLGVLKDQCLATLMTVRLANIVPYLYVLHLSVKVF